MMARPSIYSRPAKPLRIPVKRRDDFDALPKVELAAPVMVDRSTECHVTPPDVARRMVDYLDAAPGSLILEPSAGTGNLVQALLDAGHGRIVMVERHVTLADGLRRFGPVINQCFLEYAPLVEEKSFDAVLMNPPFSDVRKHIAAALGLLSRRGALVALVPITFQHPDAEHLETLPPDTFATARVNTKIIRIENGV